MSLVVGGSAVAGFSMALLFGIQATFSQPLATFLAGAGALTAGVLAYLNGERSRALTATHHRADAERERARHKEDSHRARESDLRIRYTTIATQIGNESAAIRQAGAYALTALADDWHVFGEDDERQVCINLLQWYLRVPLPEDSTPDPSEREIRQTVVDTLVKRRRRPNDHPKSWRSCAMSLSQVSLPHCTLSQLDLSNFDLNSADLRKADLSWANLYDAYLFGADLTEANLIWANLTKANLSWAKLAHADLGRAKLVGANLTSAYVLGTDLTEADLTGADLTDANLQGADLREANLTGADLSDADLREADLTDADLQGADLRGADLRGANLAGTDLTEAKQ
ncbi:pentapeptide repeat-containing protein [Nocardia nova]